MAGLFSWGLGRDSFAGRAGGGSQWRRSGAGKLQRDRRGRERIQRWKSFVGDAEIYDPVRIHQCPLWSERVQTVDEIAQSSARYVGDDHFLLPPVQGPVVH